MRLPRFPLNGILMLTALVYVQVVTFGFAGYDDILLLTGNPTAQGLSWSHIVAAFTTYDPELYLPLTLITYQIEYSIAGLSPWIYHATNLLLHLISVWLVFAITQMLAKDLGRERGATMIAALVAVVFALHPLNTQTVAWVAARKDILSSVFFFGTLYAYLRYGTTDTRRTYWVSLGLFALGLLAKVSIVATPLVFILADAMLRRPFSSKRWKDLAPFFGLSLLFGLIALFGKTQQLDGASPVQLLLLGSHSTAFFLQKLFLPTGLTLFYPYEGSISISEINLMIALIATTALLITGCVLWKRYRIAGFGIGLFFLLLSPSFLNVWKNGYLDIAFDKYAYAALFGLLIFIGFALHDLLKERLRFAVIVACIVLAPLAFVQAREWEDSETLLGKNIALYPRSTHAMVNLGTTNYESGNSSGALVLYRQALSVDPTLTIAYLNIARVEAKNGNLKSALIEAENAVEAIDDQAHRHIDDIEALFFYGSLLEQTGSINNSIDQFKRATVIAPNEFLAHLNYGIMLQKYGNNEEAFTELSRAVELRGSSLEARYRLAAIAGETGRLQVAIDQLQYIVKRDATYEKAAAHLAALQKMVR